MQVKVYEGQDMRSALEKVKEDLGPEALVLTSRKIYKSKLGNFGKPWIEVTAAVDNSMAANEANMYGKPLRLKDSRNGRRPENDPKNPSSGSTYTKRGSFEQILNQTAQVPSEKNGAKSDDILLREMKQMKVTFQALASEFSKIKERDPGLFFSGTPRKSQNSDPSSPVNCLMNEFGKLGFGNKVVPLLAEKIEQKTGNSGKVNRKTLFNILEQVISNMVKIENPLDHSWKGQKRISFLGPTGVGKTTTIAKVAADYLLNRGKRIALATIDNYRIAAVEQLKIYGQIMNIPVETAKSPQQFKNIFRKHHDKELILVDTAGRSPKDELSLQELSAFLDPALQIENHLVLSVTTRERDLFAVIDRFQNFQPQGLVFTKLDEGSQLGTILNVQLMAGYPISFMTNGQKVPEDLLPSEPRKLARMILQS